MILFAALLMGAISGAMAQECVLHKHARNEIAISPGGVYSLSDKEWGFGVHAHYFRTLSQDSPWALGGGVEMVTMHGGHYTISAGAKYNFLHFLNLSLMPGVTFYKQSGYDHDGHTHHEHTKKAQFSLHVEFSYDLIHTEHFHFGPAVDYSWSRHDNHFMVGLHCAYGF